MAAHGHPYGTATEQSSVVRKRYRREERSGRVCVAVLSSRRRVEDYDTFLPPWELLMPFCSDAVDDVVVLWASGQPILHMQIMFEEGRLCDRSGAGPEELYYLTYTTDRDRGHVHASYTKRFTRDEHDDTVEWSYIDLDVGRDAEDTMRAAARELADAKAPFNTLGYVCFYTLPFSGLGRSFFCVQLLVTILQEGGLLKDTVPHRAKIAAVYSDLLALSCASQPLIRPYKSVQIV